jgi:hypothetical protein
MTPEGECGFPPPTPEEQDHMIRFAWTIVRRMKFRAHEAGEFVQDLEMAGWVAFYTYPHLPESQRWDRVWNAMMDAWCLWRFGVTHRGKKQHIPRVVNFVPLEEWQGDATVREEARLEARDILHHLCDQMRTPRYHGVAPSLRGIALADGLPLFADERAQCGIHSSARLSDHKKLLRKLLTKIGG